MVKTVLNVIMREHQDPECFLEAPPTPQERVSDFMVDKVDWSSMPTSKPSSVKYVAYEKADNEFVWADYHTSRILSGLDWLKITYGSLSCRPEVWGPHIDLQAQPDIGHSGSTITCNNMLSRKLPLSLTTSFN